MELGIRHARQPYNVGAFDDIGCTYGSAVVKIDDFFPELLAPETGLWGREELGYREDQTRQPSEELNFSSGYPSGLSCYLSNDRNARQR